MFTADQVWGLAVAADRINGGYFKEQLWGQSDSGESKLLKETNKAMVKYWLRNNNFTEATAEDIAKGQEIRNYFNGFLLKQISGKINEFEQQALRIAQMDEFTNRNMLEFAIVSCLPSVMIRDQSRNELAREVRHSTQLTGNVGDKIQGEIEVVKCYYSKDYDKYRVTAKLVDSFVDFWYNSNLEAGDRISIKAKIKSVRGDNTTQLNFVKRA
jgi:vacuolar-type H+-ATPase subunit I/STV1